MTYTLKKELGQVFTPSNISRLMALFFQGRTYDEILDPAAGSGSLLEACMDLIDRETKLSAVEIDEDLIDILIDKGFDTSYMNFFDFDRRVDGIIMNPPYIRQELLTSENNKDILEDSIQVDVNKIKEDNIEISIVLYTSITEYNKFLNIKQEININILKILEAEGIKLAYPGRNVYVQK